MKQRRYQGVKLTATYTAQLLLLRILGLMNYPFESYQLNVYSKK